jgi:photosystem II stability/assembly factor-like uncharacterized protein
MNSHGAIRRFDAVEHRSIWRRMLPIVLGNLWGLCGSPAANADRQPAPAEVSPAAENQADSRSAILESFRHDAALADVCFVDRSLGWAVGDRGAIWHSRDGGATWLQQSSGVSCRLNSVFFADSSRGWIVGGECRPHAHATRGIVLRTTDGGKNWTPMPKLVLPLLTRIQFFNAHQGVAIGHSTAFNPAGVFRTEDGGESWQPLPTDAAGGWLAGDFLDAETGAVAGAAGRFATLARRQIMRSPLAVPSLHSFHAMQLVPPTGGWLVGDGGVVMTTADLGHSWQSPSAELPQFATNHFDFHAVAVAGPRVWVAGSPGTLVFHSPDGGQNWLTASTGQTAPIRALHFVDADHGWAVGDFGHILATHDGGRTWQRQRAGAERARLLAVFADAADVPLELLAEVGAADGYIATVEILHNSPANSRGDENALHERTCEAMLLAGAASADIGWRFPLPPDDLALRSADVLAALDRANDGRAVEQCEAHLVRTLRMWRPDVVVTNGVSGAGSDPGAALLAALLMRSIEAAAEPTRHVELANDVGLPAWQVKKVYSMLPPTSRGSESLPTGRFAPLLGTTLADFVAPARRLLAAERISPPDTCELKLLMSQAADASGQSGLFGGVPPSAISETRRPPAALPRNDLEDLRRMAARRRHLAELLERTGGNAAWVGQVADLTNDLKPDDGAELLMQLAESYRTSGLLDLAADTYYLLARRFPDHPLVDRALVWLVQFYASREAGHCAAPHQQTNVRGRDSFSTGDSVDLASARIEKESRPPSAAPAVGLSPDDRLRRAIQLAEYLKTSRPALYAEPAVRFAEVVAQRQLGFANPAQRYFLTLRQLPENDPWRECAATEEWLAKPADLPPPKVFGACRPAPEPPHLDGQLDEPFWGTADRLRLRDHADGAQLSDSADVRLAYDEEFLYIAVHCPKLSAGDYPADARPRPRDSDLLQHDRVALQFDIDRDFTTAFEFTVDCRGFAHDAAWGDAHWNPNWYVAAASDESSWTIEAAVPLDELVTAPPAAHHVWALAVRRTIPRTGYQTWAGASSLTESPSQFGLLIFE